MDRACLSQAPPLSFTSLSVLLCLFHEHKAKEEDGRVYPKYGLKKKWTVNVLCWKSDPSVPIQKEHNV